MRFVHLYLLRGPQHNANIQYFTLSAIPPPHISYSSENPMILNRHRDPFTFMQWLPETGKYTKLHSQTLNRTHSISHTYSDVHWKRHKHSVTKTDRQNECFSLWVWVSLWLFLWVCECLCLIFYLSLFGRKTCMVDSVLPTLNSMA